MTAEEIARASCTHVFEAMGEEYAASIADAFSAGVAAGITLAATGEMPTLDMFACDSWRSLGIVAGYDAWFTEEDQRREETAA